jgi:hypothetical protein
MEINTHGIMRGGIHIVHSWIISKFGTDSVLYYNNIRDPSNLQDRLISKKDTRVQKISQQLISNISENKAQLILKSFESKDLDLYKRGDFSEPINLIIIRNPYNNLASSIAYTENNGTCPDIVCDDRFIRLWLYFAEEFLGITNHLPNKKTILYDNFIQDADYRRGKAIELGIKEDPDVLKTIYMGGGSSFSEKGTSYHDRYKKYEEHPLMIKLFNDPIISEYWGKINNFKT